jgi:hypothetical protein
MLDVIGNQAVQIISGKNTRSFMYRVNNHFKYTELVISVSTIVRWYAQSKRHNKKAGKQNM